MRQIAANLAIVATLATAIFAANSASGQAAGTQLSDFAGMWESIPRGPGPRGLGGPGRGGPPPGAGQRGDRPPPPGEDDASDLPGPNVEGLDRGDKMTYAIMTPAGRAAFEAMDPHDLPSNNCRSNGMPSLAMIPDLQDWSVGTDAIVIHYADFNTTRPVSLGADPGGPSSYLGHSTAKFENGVLTITTTKLLASLGGLGRNAPGSGSRTVVERYSLSADGQRLTGTMTVHDPEYLTRDLVLPLSLSRAPEGSRIPDDVECSVEASQRYLDG
jgi:hypothetical protein